MTAKALKLYKMDFAKSEVETISSALKMYARWCNSERCKNSVGPDDLRELRADEERALVLATRFEIARREGF
jgi:hypothetical protein